MMSFLFGVLLLAVSVLLIRVAKPREGRPRPAFMKWSGSEATVAMTCTTSLVLGFGFAAQGLVELFT